MSCVECERESYGNRPAAGFGKRKNHGKNNRGKIIVDDFIVEKLSRGYLGKYQPRLNTSHR